jgi:hypothetical protein
MPSRYGKTLAEIVDGRRAGILGDEAMKSLEELGLNKKGKALILRWVSGEVPLVAPSR